MKVEVLYAIDELKKQFSTSILTADEDGQGGAHIIIEGVAIGSKYQPSNTWLGFQIPAQYPYADIYPVFIGADIRRVTGVPFAPPVTPGHNYRGRPALQISRRNSAAQNGQQKVSSKILKVLNFLENLT